MAYQFQFRREKFTFTNRSFRQRSLMVRNWHSFWVRLQLALIGAIFFPVSLCLLFNSQPLRLGAVLNHFNAKPYWGLNNMKNLWVAIKSRNERIFLMIWYYCLMVWKMIYYDFQCFFCSWHIGSFSILFCCYCYRKNCFSYSFLNNVVRIYEESLLMRKNHRSIKITSFFPFFSNTYFMKSSIIYNLSFTHRSAVPYLEGLAVGKGREYACIFIQKLLLNCSGQYIWYSSNHQTKPIIQEKCGQDIMSLFFHPFAKSHVILW